MLLWMVLAFLSSAWADAKRVAVLEFRGAGVEEALLEKLSEFCRRGIREGLTTDQFIMLDKANTQVVLEANGISMEQCVSECEVKLGREMGVDFIVTGNVSKIENSYVLSVKLHETQEGSLLDTDELIEKSSLKILEKTKESAQSMAEENIAMTVDESDDTIQTVFRTNVPGVIVWYDGAICTTDSSLQCTGQAPKGKHNFQFQKKDYKTVNKSLKISKSKRDFSIELKSRFAHVTVDVIPPSLQLTLNNQPHKALSDTKLKPGTYAVKASGPCHLNQGFKAKFKANEVYKTALVVETKRTGIDIEAYDKNGQAIEADVYIEERFMGATPLQKAIDLCARDGRTEQTIEVRYQGESKVTKVAFEENTIKPVVVKFK
ncbi:MAG: hypothetical protein VX278_19665 [Myxococcota bacterium]|nr:hypothetical protein [Myxococcota bacterium]